MTTNKAMMSKPKASQIYSKRPLKINDLRFLYYCLFCLLMGCADALCFRYEWPWSRLIIRLIIFLFLIGWLIRNSPYAFSQRNIMIMISMSFTHIYPAWSNIFQHQILEYYLMMILPNVGFLFLLTAFRLENLKIKDKGFFHFFRFLFIFIFLPVLFSYFVLYPYIIESPYLPLHVAYFCSLVGVFYYGMEVNFCRESKSLVFASMAVMAITNIAISYYSFVEHPDWWVELTILLALLSRVLLFYGLAIEDQYRKSREFLH